MAAPTSEVAICNLALARLGDEPITSITAPQTASEVRCAQHYDQARRMLLNKYIFNFSKKLTTLTEAADMTPAHGFGAAFRLPADHIRLLAIGDISLINGDLPPYLYELSEGYIFTSSANDEGLPLTYIFDAKVVTKFNPLFINLLKLQLASDMAYAYTLKTSVKDKLDSDLVDAQLAAAAVEGQQKPLRRVERSRVRAVRRGGRARDNSRYP